MDFSEVIPGVTIAVLSPNSQMLALSNGQSIVIKDVNTLNPLPFLYSQFNDNSIQQVVFSPDSQLIAINYQKRGYVEIRKSPDVDPNWCARIEDTGSGIEFIMWAPDSLQLLVFSEFQIKVSIYNFSNKSTSQIKSPKYSSDKGVSFSNDGKFMALAEKKDAKDYLGIYCTRDWKLLNYQQVETTDLAGLAWSPNDAFIAIWDSEINYKLLIHCPSQGLLMKYQPYDYALGIKNVQFCHSGDLVAVGSFDEKIRLINLISLRLITEFEHKASLQSYKDIIIYKEEEYKDTQIANKSITKYVSVEPTQAKINQLKLNPQSANIQQGIGLMQWSYDDAYIASKNDNMPNTLWIWESQSLELKYVLIQLHPIKHFAWATKSQTLTLCTGQNKIYFWSPASTSACDMPYENRQYNVQKIDWSEDQKCLLLFEKTKEVVVAYPQIEFIAGQEENYQEEDQNYM